jgi:acyl transferase domain-containing protein
VVGDQKELRALTDVFLEDGVRPRKTALGALKTQIGHTKCTAGIAGLIKVVNCVRHGILPPILNLTKPIDDYTDSSPFHFRTEKAGYWREDRRVAGLSAFGFGGTNFHAVIENYTPERPAAPLKAWPSELFVFNGENARDAEKVMDKITELYGVNDKWRMREFA